MTIKSIALRLLPGALLCAVLAILMVGGWLPTRKKPTLPEVAKVEVPAVVLPEPVPEPAPAPEPIIEAAPAPPDPEPEPVSHALAAMDLIAKMRTAPSAPKPKTVKRSPAPPPHQVVVMAPLPMVDPGPAPTGPRWPTYVVRLRDDALPWWRVVFREGGE